MNKPKYRLGDIIYDDTLGTTELIIAIKKYDDWFTDYRYKTQYIDNPKLIGKFDAWWEEIIDIHCRVIGNLFDKEKQHD